MGVAVGEAEIKPDMELAINPGQVYGMIDGEPTIDPAFGLEAVWIREERRERTSVRLHGCRFIDSIATHLSQLLTNNASQLIGHEEVQNLLEMLSHSTPKLVEGFVPDQLPPQCGH
ncbi:FHIPEP family type III secretion protein [Vibrio lentus]|nr:FHIPEP family type III secretion protein [Vibrio lentus]